MQISWKTWATIGGVAGLSFIMLRRRPTVFDLLTTDLSQELIIHRSSQPKGDIGWEIRLRRSRWEDDWAYAQRSLLLHRDLEEELLKDKTAEGLQSTLDRVRSKDPAS